MLARLPLDISDADVHDLAVEEGWNDDFLRGGPLRPPPAPVSGNICNAFANGVLPKLPPVPRGAVVASPAPVPKAAAAAVSTISISPGGVPVTAATPEPAASIPAAPTLAPPPPVSGAALPSPVPEATVTVSKAGAPAQDPPICVICQANTGGEGAGVHPLLPCPVHG